METRVGLTEGARSAAVARTTSVYLRSPAATALTTAPMLAPSGIASSARTMFPGIPQADERGQDGDGRWDRSGDQHASGDRRRGQRRGAAGRRTTRTGERHPREHAERSTGVKPGASRTHRELRTGQVKRSLGPLMTNERAHRVDRGRRDRGRARRHRRVDGGRTGPSRRRQDRADPQHTRSSRSTGAPRAAEPSADVTGTRVGTVPIARGLSPTPKARVEGLSPLSSPEGTVPTPQIDHSSQQCSSRRRVT